MLKEKLENINFIKLLNLLMVYLFVTNFNLNLIYQQSIHDENICSSNSDNISFDCKTHCDLGLNETLNLSFKFYVQDYFFSLPQIFFEYQIPFFFLIPRLNNSPPLI